MGYVCQDDEVLRQGDVKIDMGDQLSGDTGDTSLPTDGVGRFRGRDGHCQHCQTNWSPQWVKQAVTMSQCHSLKMSQCHNVTESQCQVMQVK